jgi:hypothetical protein
MSTMVAYIDTVQIQRFKKMRPNHLFLDAYTSQQWRPSLYCKKITIAESRGLLTI